MTRCSRVVSLCLGFAFAFATSAVHAQTEKEIAAAAAAAAPRIFISAKDVEALVAAQSAPDKAGPRSTLSPLLIGAPFTAIMEYREGSSGISRDYHAHSTEGELFVVLDGSGAISVGGELVNPTLDDIGTYHSSSIVGSTIYPVVKGDMLLLPENTPHKVTAVNGRLVLMTLHLPRPATSAKASSGPAVH